MGRGKSGYKIAKACYDEGRGTGDETRLRWASQILHWCVRNGEVRALVALGRLRLEGSGVTQSTNAAAALFERAAERLHAPGALAMGRLHWEVRGDVFRAYVWLRIAHSLGSGDVEEGLRVLSESMHPSLAARAELRAQRWLTRHTEAVDGDEESAVQLLPLPPAPPSAATAAPMAAFAAPPATSLVDAMASSAADIDGITAAVPMATNAVTAQAALPYHTHDVPSRMPSRASTHPPSSTHTSSSAAAVAALTGAGAAATGGLPPGTATDMAVDTGAASKTGTVDDADAYSYYSDYSGYSDDEVAPLEAAPAAAAPQQAGAAAAASRLDASHDDDYYSYSYSYSNSDGASEDGDHDAYKAPPPDGRAFSQSGPALGTGVTASSGAGPALSTAASSLCVQPTGLATESGLQEGKGGEEVEEEDDDDDELDVLSQGLYDYYSDA